MNIEQAYDYIKLQRPELINLSGKTSTGKSTFANRLSNELGYEIIELDQVVRDSVVEAYGIEDEGQAFVDIYKDRDRLELIDSFVAATKQKFFESKSDGHPVILDGAVANPQTLKQLLDELASSVIVYLHPIDIDGYRRNITSRFMTASATSNASLPARFWQMVDAAEFTLFCESRVMTTGLQHAIAQYSLESQAESSVRLDNLRRNFDNVLAVDV